MNAFPILARRELLRYRGLFASALVMGLFVAVVPMLTSSAGVSIAERRGAAAVGLAALWSLLVAAGLGATALARRRGVRPLGFDLRLPASPAAIWGARLGAAYVAALGAGALVLGVAALFGIDFELAAESFDIVAHEATASAIWIEGLLVLSPLLLAFVLLLAQMVGAALAGERWLAAVGLVAVLAAKGGVWLAARELFEVYAFGGIQRLVVGALALGVAVLAATSYRQLVRGRDDSRAAMRAATPVLVAGALVIAAGSLLYARWYLNPSPSALIGEPVAISAGAAAEESWKVPRRAPWSLDLGGGWRAISGSAAGRESHLSFTWLVRDDDRRARLINRSPSFAASRLERAADAPRIVWLALERDAAGASFTLRYIDLDRGELETKASEWSWKGAPAWRLAADGEAVEILVARDTWKSLPLPPR